MPADLSSKFGSLVVSCVARGTSTLKSNASWQIPIGLFYVTPTIVASLIWFVPEVSQRGPSCR